MSAGSAPKAAQCCRKAAMASESAAAELGCCRVESHRSRHSLLLHNRRDEPARGADDLVAEPPRGTSRSVGARRSSPSSSRPAASSSASSAAAAAKVAAYSSSAVVGSARFSAKLCSAKVASCSSRSSSSASSPCTMCHSGGSTPSAGSQPTIKPSEAPYAWKNRRDGLPMNGWPSVLQGLRSCTSGALCRTRTLPSSPTRSCASSTSDSEWRHERSHVSRSSSSESHLEPAARSRFVIESSSSSSSERAPASPRLPTTTRLAFFSYMLAYLGCSSAAAASTPPPRSCWSS
mmetsp:Transcript_49356/g.114081  ORF Transcript_49356/g.114081 Transcript_49356/m.114081 type:complete len:291 (-) Transcript_49356:1139-2011(-)